MAALVLAVIGLVAAPAGAAAADSPYVAVRGNHLVDAAGKVERLLGVDRSGAEYECLSGREIFDGPTDESSVSAIAAWHANAVRIPLNEDCWLGINGVPVATSGRTYRSAIESYVKRLGDHGLVAILDLHWAAPGSFVAKSQWPMADADHAPAFWRSVASSFKGDHGVVFDLFNEPYILSWDCWLHGCTTSYDDSGTTVTYQTAGMQALVDAVRSTGSRAPLMLGGLLWSDAETGWLSHEPVDPDRQLIVSFHTYNDSICSSLSCWQSTIGPLAKSVPVVTGEIGEYDCAQGYIDTYMSWADAHGISYLGWAWDSTGPPSDWNCNRGPSLITDYAGDPTTFGIGLKDHLAFEARLGAPRA